MMNGNNILVLKEILGHFYITIAIRYSHQVTYKKHSTKNLIFKENNSFK
ncbi:hypothetical protein PPBDW_II1266 [Photobacterium kishitanii]|nr:hypothetical protein PPBDW_II1266 [Photobacterium kishitanii]